MKDYLPGSPSFIKDTDYPDIYKKGRVSIVVK